MLFLLDMREILRDTEENSQKKSFLLTFFGKVIDAFTIGTDRRPPCLKSVTQARNPTDPGTPAIRAVARCVSCFFHYLTEAPCGCQKGIFYEPSLSAEASESQ